MPAPPNTDTETITTTGTPDTPEGDNPPEDDTPASLACSGTQNTADAAALDAAAGLLAA
ncbi:hypothetical protein ACFC1T_02295 [Kitasatospora sp. NPDC056076]|uniref:hypothetical protein n=1 Tax=Kitasatospora sp. NPDC056076 TaxID=3345703 RepID=UPI0035DB07C4